MSAEKLANELKNILLKRIQADQLVVPTIPSVVQKVQEVLREGDPSASKRAAEILEQDAFLSARALRVAWGAKGASGQKKMCTASGLIRQNVAHDQQFQHAQHIGCDTVLRHILPDYDQALDFALADARGDLRQILSCRFGSDSCQARAI